MKKIKSKLIIFVASLTILCMACPIISYAATETTTFAFGTGKAKYDGDDYLTKKTVTVWLYDSSGTAFTTATKSADYCFSISVSKFSAKAKRAYGAGYEVNASGEVVGYDANPSN